jgi:hypothetical protein
LPSAQSEPHDGRVDSVHSRLHTFYSRNDLMSSDYFHYRRVWDSAVVTANKAKGSTTFRGNIFFSCHKVVTGSGDNPASYTMNNGGCYLGCKSTVVWSWPFTSI